MALADNILAYWKLDNNGSGGINLDSGFVMAGSGGVIRIDKDTQFQIGRSSMGTVSDTITIVGACSTNNKSAIAAMTWIEQR